MAGTPKNKGRWKQTNYAGQLAELETTKTTICYGQPKLSLVSTPVTGFVPLAMAHRYFTWSFLKNVSVKSANGHKKARHATEQRGRRYRQLLISNHHYMFLRFRLSQHPLSSLQPRGEHPLGPGRNGPVGPIVSPGFCLYPSPSEHQVSCKTAFLSLQRPDLTVIAAG